MERLVWRMIGRTSDGCLRWTDDTQMALDLAEAGALWGIVNGSERLPQVRLEARDVLVEVATRMFQRHQCLGT